MYLTKKDEINYLKHGTINIKYEYLRNNEHATSNMKHLTENMKPERKHEMGEKKKNFEVFGKSVHEKLNKKDEINYLKYGTINIKYKYLCNSEHEHQIRNT